jgi:beta-lactamase class A
MNWLKRIVCSFCEWAGCRRDLEVRITWLERHIKPRPRIDHGKTTAGAENLKTSSRKLLDEGLSQSEVARRLGVSRQYISKIVRREF